MLGCGRETPLGRFHDVEEEMETTPDGREREREEDGLNRFDFDET